MLRFVAAVLVVVSHASAQSLSGGFLWSLQYIGYPAVMIFFVLSGYVISYVASEKENTLSDYATSRLARLYSVLIPAIILTFAADSLGSVIDPHLYEVPPF